METISIPKDDRSVHPDIAANMGNNQPDIETVLFYLGQIRQHEAIVGNARKALSRVKKQAISAGIVLQDLLQEALEAEMDPSELAQKYARRAHYSGALNNPYAKGRQGSLFDFLNARQSSIPSHDEQCEKAHQSQFIRALLGDPFDDDAYKPDNPFYSHAVDGFTRGQNIRNDRMEQMMEQLKAAQAAEEAKKVKKTDKTDGA